MSYRKQAVTKLDAEYKAFKGGWYQSAMKSAVRDALVEFCGKNEEFAQAVVQGGSFGDCMKAVSKGVSGAALSDIEAYRRAAAFFSDGAQVRMELTIQLEPAEVDGEKDIVIDLSDFF